MTETAPTDPEDELHAAFVEQFPPVVTPELRETIRAHRDHQGPDFAFEIDPKTGRLFMHGATYGVCELRITAARLTGWPQLLTITRDQSGWNFQMESEPLDGPAGG